MSSPGFFTGLPRHRLPHPAVPIRLIVAAHHAVARAIQILREENRIQLATALEEPLTHEVFAILQDRLLATLEVHGFDPRRFGRIQCSPEVWNHDRSRRVVPDLVLILLKRDNLRVLPSQDGLFVECKPVDGKHAVGAHYCDRGICRFVDGEYASAMQEGLMVAYVRGGRTITKDLSPVLTDPALHAKRGFPSTPTKIPSAPIRDCGEPLHVTTHRRNFTWPGDQGPACEIRLYHSWHMCD